MTKLTKGTWTYVQKPENFSKEEKRSLTERIKNYVEESTLLKERVRRLEIKAGRVYFYYYEEISQTHGTLTKPLIEGKYFEFPFARITIYDKKSEQCCADYQRHNGKWFTLIEGTIGECLNYIEENMGYFY